MKAPKLRDKLENESKEDYLFYTLRKIRRHLEIRGYTYHSNNSSMYPYVRGGFDFYTRSKSVESISIHYGSYIKGIMISYTCPSVTGNSCIRSTALSPDSFTKIFRKFKNVRVYPYSPRSTNYKAILSISNFLKKYNCTEVEDMVKVLGMSKNWGLKLNALIREYPSLSYSAYLAMLCKWVCLTGQGRDPMGPGFKYRNKLPKRKCTIHEYMKLMGITWKSSYRNLNALFSMMGLPKIKKTDITYSDKVNELNDYEVHRPLDFKSKSESDPILKSSSDSKSKSERPGTSIIPPLLSKVSINFMDLKEVGLLRGLAITSNPTVLHFIPMYGKDQDLKYKLSKVDFKDLKYQVSDNYPSGSLILI